MRLIDERSIVTILGVDMILGVVYAVSASREAQVLWQVSGGGNQPA
tara:strand:- start:282 stop:419 length:138 start_codon:yes stop_codon:yes gene_type:complete